MVARNFPANGVYLMPNASPNSAEYVACLAKGIYASQRAATDSTFVYPTFYSIAARTYSFRTRRGRSYELGRAESGEAQLRVDNSDRLFDPTNTSSPLYGNLLPFRGLHINSAHDGTATANTTPLTGNFINDSNANAFDWTSPTFAGAGFTGSLAVSVNANDATAETSATNNWWILKTNGTYANLARSNTRAWSGTYSYSNAIDAANGQYVCLDVPVVAGRQYAISSYAYVGAGAPAMSVWDGVPFRTGASASASVNLVGAAFNRYTINVTPVSPRITVVFYMPANAQIWFDGVQVEIGSTASTFTTTGPKVTGLFTGFVERYPQSFQAPNRGEVNLIATDYMASMSQVTLASAYVADVLLDDPIYYYPLDSEQGATTAGNFSAYNQPALSIVSEPYNKAGTLNGSVTFGDSTAASSIIAAGTTGAAFLSDTTYLTTQYLQADNLQDILLQSTAGYTATRSYTIECWLKGNSFSATNGITPWSLIASDGSTNFTAFTSATGQLYVRGGGYGGGASVLTASLGTLTAGVWYFLSATITVNPSTSSISVSASLNGGTAVTASGTAYATNNSSLQVGRLTNGSVAHVTIFDKDLSTSANARYQVGVAAFYGELLSERFTRLFGLAGFDYAVVSAPASISYAQSLTDCSGKNLFDVAQQTADSESGTWFVAGNGTVRFNNRRYRNGQTVSKFSFADSAAGLAYQASEVVLNNDPTFILNNISITRDGGTTTNAFDTQSTADYFARTYERTIYNTSDLEAIDCAFYLLDRYKDPSLRCESFTLTPSSNGSVWTATLSLELDDLITVNKAKMLSGTFWSLPSYVERIEHDVDGTTGTWTTRVYVSPQLRTYNMVGALSTTLNTASIVGASSLVLNRGLLDNTDFFTGTLLEIEPASATANEFFAVAGAASETATTITIPIVKVTGTAYTTLAASMTPDSTALSFADWTQIGGATRLLIGNEIVTTTAAVSASTATVSARGQNVTNPQRHSVGERVYALPAVLTLASAHAASSVVAEALPDLPTDPLTAPNVSLSSTLLTIAGTKTTTGNYTTLPFYGLLDYNNTPSTDFATGDLFVLTNDNFTTTENAVFVCATPVSTSTNNWTGTFYKQGSTGVLAADVSEDANTITLGAASPAGVIGIVIDNELMQVTGGAGTALLTVTRGTPDAAVWTKLSQAPHQSRNSTTVVRYLVAGGLTLTYANNNAARVSAAIVPNFIRLTY